MVLVAVRQWWDVMRIKLLMTMSSGALAVWLGASFLSSAGQTPGEGPVTGPEHADSHRLGALGEVDAELPRWEARDSGFAPVVTLILAD